MFASQPTTKEIMKSVREHMQERENELHRNMKCQSYVMNVVNDPIYDDVEKLYDGIDQIIATSTNQNCKPIINRAVIDNVTYRQIIDELIYMRSIIRDILLKSFVIPPDVRELIKQMFDMVRDVMKKNNADEFHVFTTNYDLVMETYADEAGLEVVNGFQPYYFRNGIWADTWDRRTNRPPLYLTKLHGSIYWHRDGNDIVETGAVAQRTADQDVIIAPTEGAKDYDGKPFSALMNRFKESIKEVDILLVIGFSYRDNEIARIIRSRVRNGMTLISISPDIDKDIHRVLGTVPKTERTHDSRITVIERRIILCKHKFELGAIHDINTALKLAYNYARRMSNRKD